MTPSDPRLTDEQLDDFERDGCTDEEFYALIEEVRALRAALAAPILAKRQPCGCVVCTCEDEERCHGCGAKHCGTHTVGEIPTPALAAPETPDPDARVKKGFRIGIEAAAKAVEMADLFWHDGDPRARIAAKIRALASPADPESAPRAGKCPNCENGSGYVRRVGWGNDEIVEDCPNHLPRGPGEDA